MWVRSWRSVDVMCQMLNQEIDSVTGNVLTLSIVAVVAGRAKRCPRLIHAWPYLTMLDHAESQANAHRQIKNCFYVYNIADRINLNWMIQEETTTKGISNHPYKFMLIHAWPCLPCLGMPCSTMLPDLFWEPAKASFSLLVFCIPKDQSLYKGAINPVTANGVKKRI